MGWVWGAGSVRAWSSWTIATAVRLFGCSGIWLFGYLAARRLGDDCKRFSLLPRSLSYLLSLSLSRHISCGSREQRRPHVEQAAVQAGHGVVVGQAAVPPVPAEVPERGGGEGREGRV